MKLLRFAKAWRWVLAGLLAFQAADAAWDVLWWHMPLLALIPLVLAGGVVWAVRANARTIRNLENQTRPRPDYARIAFLQQITLSDVIAAAEAKAEREFRAENAPPGGTTMAEFGERLTELADALNQAQPSCSCGHPSPVLYHSQATGETFCGHCEQPRAARAVTVTPPPDSLPRFWLPPGTRTAPPGCLCRWEARSDGYLVISSPSYYGRGMFPHLMACSIPGHDA